MVLASIVNESLQPSVWDLLSFHCQSRLAGTFRHMSQPTCLTLHSYSKCKREHTELLTSLRYNALPICLLALWELVFDFI